MTGELGVIMPFLMIVAIIAIVSFSKNQRAKMEMEARRSPEDAALIGSMQQQIDKLADRVAVLEKLLTDDDRRLAGEIEKLRDKPQPRY